MYLCAVNNSLADIMPRQERLQSATGIYHVMLRGINRQDIFEDDEDHLQMIACLRGLTERYDENGVVHSQVNERLWCGNTPALSIDRCLLWSYTEVMKKEKMITEPSPGQIAVANKDINGKEFYEKGTKKDNPNNYSYGITNMPGMENDPSPDNNVYVFTASFLSPLNQAKNTAHEGYGHAYFFELSKTNPSINPNHTKEIVNYVYEYDPEWGQMRIPVFGPTNYSLESQIKKVERQAIINYENRNK